MQLFGFVHALQVSFTALQIQALEFQSEPWIPRYSCHGTTFNTGHGHVILLLPNFLLLGLQNSHSSRDSHLLPVTRAHSELQYIWPGPGTPLAPVSSPLQELDSCPNTAFWQGFLQHMGTIPRIMTATCLAPKGLSTAVPCPTTLDLVPKIA